MYTISIKCIYLLVFEFQLIETLMRIIEFMVSNGILRGGDAESMERIVTGATPATLLGMGFGAGSRGSFFFPHFRETSMSPKCGKTWFFFFESGWSGGVGF